jgi:hypothetical protein
LDCAKLTSQVIPPSLEPASAVAESAAEIPVEQEPECEQDDIPGLDGNDATIASSNSHQHPLEEGHEEQTTTTRSSKGADHLEVNVSDESDDCHDSIQTPEDQHGKQPPSVHDLDELKQAEQERAEKRQQKKLRKRQLRLEKFDSVLTMALQHRRQRLLQQAWKALQDQLVASTMNYIPSGSLSISSSTSGMVDAENSDDRSNENTTDHQQSVPTHIRKTKKEKKAERQKRFLEDLSRQCELRAKSWEPMLAREAKLVKSIKHLVVAHFCRQNRVSFALGSFQRDFEREEVWLHVFGPSSTQSERLDMMVIEAMNAVFPRH